MVIRRLRRHALVNKGPETPVAVSGDRHALLRWRAAADNPEDAGATERDSHRPFDHTGRHDTELRVGPNPALPAEATTDKWRQQSYVLLLQAERLRETAGGPGSELTRVVHGEMFVVVPHRDR